MNIPIKDVLSRDETIPHNHSQALFIYNLEPSYMGGSHWVATYVKNGFINYFDSFGMPPFQEIVNNNNNNRIFNNNNNRIFIQDNPSVQSTVINGVLFSQRQRPDHHTGNSTPYSLQSC